MVSVITSSMPERVEKPAKGEEPPMAGEAQRGAGKAVRRLRARWLEPSPPLAVDDEPVWIPAPDPVDQDVAEAEQPVAPPLVS
jgi:hypothetical protein